MPNPGHDVEPHANAILLEIAALRPTLVTQVIRTMKESSLGYVVSYPGFRLSRIADLLDRPRRPRRTTTAPLPVPSEAAALPLR